MAIMVSKSTLVQALVVFWLVLNVHGCAVTIRNYCSYPVTACARSGSSATSLYQMAAGSSQRLDFGSACLWPSAVVYASVGGQCTDTNQANLAEFNIVSGTDYYDLSNVDAYTIGLQIIPSTSGCATLTCSIANIPSFCVPTNVLVPHPTGSYSCHNTDGQIGYATVNNQRFKTACPEAYSYNYDDTSVRTCGNGGDYQVIFCPLGLPLADI